MTKCFQNVNWGLLESYALLLWHEVMSGHLFHSLKPVFL